jgi:hypothetical protein
MKGLKCGAFFVFFSLKWLKSFNTEPDAKRLFLLVERLFLLVGKGIFVNCIAQIAQEAPK